MVFLYYGRGITQKWCTMKDKNITNIVVKAILMISLIVTDVFDYAIFFTLNDYNKYH